MGVYRFEDLRVWQAAKRQSDRVGALLKRPEFGNGELRSCVYGSHGRHCLSDQDAADLIAESESIGKMIRRLQQTLEAPQSRRLRQGPRTMDGPRAKDQGRPKDEDPRPKDDG